MAKRLPSDDGERHSHSHRHRRPEKRRRRRRLLLVTMDWNRGYSVYEIDVDGFDPDPGSGAVDMDSKAQRLPRRPVVRLAGCYSQQFVAAGSKIFDFCRSSNAKANIVFDAETLGVTVTPPFQAAKDFPEFWAVGHTVYALDSSRLIFSRDSKVCFERLTRQPLPRHGEWQWELLPPPPFRLDYVTSRALHPDGATVFLSIDNTGTFSFDTERLSWASHGRWSLPFDGEAFFVGELGAWVGICSRRWGHIAACQVVSPRGGGRCGGPSFKEGKDLLYCRNGKNMHISASLTYLGNAGFCLQETLTQTQKDYDMYKAGWMPRMLLRMVTFRVEFSSDGELCAVDRRSRMHKLSGSSSAMHTPVAFCI